MLTSIVFLTLLYALQVSNVTAACCNLVKAGGCGDYTDGTPCCGIRKCTFGCCFCKAVTQAPVTAWNSKDKPFVVGTATAPPGTTWYCRFAKVTNFLVPPLPTQAAQKRSAYSKIAAHLTDSPVVSASQAPPQAVPTPPAVARFALHELADLQSSFDTLSAKRKLNITLDQYFGYFDITEDDRNTKLGKNVEAKFRAHDVNGDGVMTLEEAMLYCDATGCDT